MTGLFLLLVVGFIKANATLDKSGHMMYVEYSISEPAKDEGVIYVDILFHYKGETYRVARHRYPEPMTSIVDTFPWVSKDRWEGGDLEVVVRKANGGIERSYISESSIEVEDLGYQVPEFEHEVNGALVKANNEPDPYAWRMLGYDPGHTGYYPFHLYPPLELKWILRDWGHPGSWITDVSGAAGHEMLFIPKSVRQWNIITARDIETGEIIWERYVTANAMTSALSEGDSILFVGTLIGFTPWQDTTFYALDPFTGELKWGKVLKTVEYSPIVVDSLVYAPHFYRVYCFTYNGDSLWSENGAYSSPVYEDGIIVGAANDTVLNARDYLTGELMWEYTEGNWIPYIMAYQNKIMDCTPNIPAHALNVQTGVPIWVNSETFLGLAHGAYGKLFWGYGVHLNGDYLTIFKWLDANNGQNLHEILLSPSDANGADMLRMLITGDSVLWVANVDMLYLLRVGQQLPFDTLPFPQSPARFASWGFPIAYKNYYIYAHEDFLVVYRADTVMDTSGQDTLTDFQVYLLYVDGNPVLRLDIPYEGQISLKLFSIAGRKVWRRQIYLEKGIHFINFPSLPSGVYFLFYDFKGHRGTKKVIILKT